MKRHWLAWPYIIWMIIFIVVPMILVVFYSVTEQTGEGYQLTFRHFHRFVDPIYINVLIRSVVLALVSTIICLLLGYPMAAILAGREFSRKKIMYMLIVLPMWMNFLLRTYAWMTLLERNGVVNTILSFLNLPSLDILYTNKAVVLGMVYNFLPYDPAHLLGSIQIDQSVIEAAQDLGGNGIVVFRRVIFPLSLPGVVSGITMVFMPAVTTLSYQGSWRRSVHPIGNLIEQQFLSSGDWGFGSALSVIMMILILLSMRLCPGMSRIRGECPMVMRFLKTYVFLIFAFLYAPILVLIVFSFNGPSPGAVGGSDTQVTGSSFRIARLCRPFTIPCLLRFCPPLLPL